MTKTERMKQAIQQRQVAAKIEAAPVKFAEVSAAGVKVREVHDQLKAEVVKPEPKQSKPAKKPKKDPLPGYDRQPEKFDTALQLHDRGRLPAGTTFHMIWDGHDWHGVLMLSDETTFKLTGRKLFRLLADIDGLYRAWKREAEGKS